MNKYKCRAECLFDCQVFFKRNLGLHKITIVNDGEFPDVDIEFISCLSRAVIKSKLMHETDIHVILETLELTENYTGVRK